MILLIINKIGVLIWIFIAQKTYNYKFDYQPVKCPNMVIWYIYTSSYKTSFSVRDEIRKNDH